MMSKASACYKVKSNMMHKFYSEPVAALDLRLTKSEASLFGMESNPLDLDVRMDEEEVEPKEEIPIPVDCPEVQDSQSPPPLFMPLSQPTPTEVAEHEEEDIEPRVKVESPSGDIQHVTLHIARSPPQCGVPAPTAAAGWSQTQVERVSSSSASHPALSSASHSPHHASNTGLAHRHSVIEEWRGLGITPSNLWLFPHTTNPRRDRNERDTSCPGEKQWSVPENPLSCPPFLQECIKSPTPSDCGYPPTACYGTKFIPLPGSYYTPPDGCQPQPKRPEYPQHPPLPHPHLTANHPPRRFTHKDLLPQRGSVIVHHPPPFQHETEKSKKFHSGGARGLLIHPPPLENLGAHSIKQEDLSQSYHHPEGEFKQEPEDLKSPQWLSKIQQLRTDFAFQMLEARRRQGCEQEHLYYPPSLQFISQLSAPRDPCNQQPDQVKGNPGGAKGALDLVNTFLQRMEHPRQSSEENLLSSTTSPSLPVAPSLHPANRLGKRGRPRKHAPKVSLFP